MFTLPDNSSSSNENDKQINVFNVSAISDETSKTEFHIEVNNEELSTVSKMPEFHVEDGEDEESSTENKIAVVLRSGKQ